MFVKSSSKYSISQKLFSKLTSISPRKTQDNYQIDIEKKIPELEKDRTLTKKLWNKISLEH